MRIQQMLLAAFLTITLLAGCARFDESNHPETHAKKRKSTFVEYGTMQENHQLHSLFQNR